MLSLRLVPLPPLAQSLAPRHSPAARKVRGDLRLLAREILQHHRGLRLGP